MDIKKAWEARSKQYKYSAEGVLPKAFPSRYNTYLDRWMFKQIEKSLPKDSPFKILDIGCGYGRVSKEISDNYPNAQLSGIDISDNYVKLYNSLLSPRGTAKVSSVTKLPYRSNTFDVVFVVTALMYLVNKKELEKGIDEISRVLKPGGEFVIIERNTTGYWFVMLGGLVSKLRGKKNAEIESISFQNTGMTKLLRSKSLLVSSQEGIPAWTLTLHLSVILNRLLPVLLRPLVAIVSFIDSRAGNSTFFSMYISYAGNKRD